MKFFIDTADINEIREAAAMGLVASVRHPMHVHQAAMLGALS